MAGASDYLENKLLEHVLMGIVFAQPTALWVSLHSSDPGDTGANEIAGGSYGRLQANTAFAVASGGSKTTSVDLVWSNMPACTVSHAGVWDAEVGGNPLFLGSLAVSKSVNLGDTFRLLAGNLTVSMV